METTKMGATKKSATKPNKRFLGAGTKRMTKRSLRNKLKKEVIAAMTKPSLRNKPKKKVIAATAPEPRPIMVAPVFAEVVLDLRGTTLLDPNKLSSVALKALITKVDDLLMSVFMCTFKLAYLGDHTARMDTVIEWIYTVVEKLDNIQFGEGGFYDMLGRAKTKAGSANDGTDSDEPANEAPQSMTADNGMDDALQSNEAPAAHGTNSENYTGVPTDHIADNASSTSKLTDGDNHRTKRRKIILRVGSRNSQAAT